MSLAGVVLSVTGNFDRQALSGAVRKAGGRVDALVHKNLDYVRCCCQKGAWGGKTAKYNAARASVRARARSPGDHVRR